MLVKFLSYVASVLGTARSRAIFVSCFALVMAFTGITAFAVVRDNSAKPSNVSSTVEKTKDTADTKDDTPQLKGLGKQQAKQQTDESANNTQSSQPSDQGTSQADGNSKQQAAAFDFALNKTALNLTTDDMSDSFTATTSDNTAIAWQTVVVGDNSDQLHVTVTQNNNTQAIIQVQAAKDMPHGSTLKILVTAKDASRNINVQKFVTVNVQ